MPIARTTDEWQVAIGKSLRDARLARQLDQESLSRRADVSKKSLWNLENGAGSTLSTLIKVTRALGKEDWLEMVDEGRDELTPLEMLNESRRRPRRPQRAPNRRND